MSLPRIIVIILNVTFATSICANESNIHLFYKSISANLPIMSWKDIRDDKIEKQNEDFSCGSASAATILRFFYGKNVYEKDIIDEVMIVGDDGTASFADLAKAVKKFGFKAIGLTLSFEKLKELNIPAIVYLRYRDKDHFSVIRGVNNKGLVLLGDPSWGNRKFSETRFKSIWETRDSDTLKGKILLIIPEDQSLAKINNDFFKLPSINNTAIQLLTLRK